LFDQNSNVVAATGGAIPYDMPLKWAGMAIFHGYIYLAGRIAGHRLLWGSNCAIRRKGWLEVRSKVLMKPDIWEDYDLAFCLNDYGKIKYLHRNMVGVSFRAMHTSFSHHVSYQFRSVRTFYYRANPLRLALFIILWTTTFLVYPPAAFDDWLLKRREARLKPVGKA
jgi:hypothetical protein